MLAGASIEIGAYVDISLLGGCRLALNGTIVPGMPANFFRIAACLILDNPYYAVPRAKLAGLLWPHADKGSAAANLRQTLARIRSRQSDLGFEFINSTFDTVLLKPSDNLRCDLLEWEKLKRLGLGAGAVELCRLYGGDLLADLGDSGAEYEEWLSAQRDRLRQELLDAVHAALAPRSTLSRPDQLLCARKLFDVEPTDEDACQLLMREAAEQHQWSRVNAVYQSLLRHLRDDYGVSPTLETVTLYKQLTRDLDRTLH